MTDTEITLRISPGESREIREFARKHQYEPEELVRLGISLTQMLIHEKGLGHKFFIMTENGEALLEWVFPEPQSFIDREVRKMLDSTGRDSDPSASPSR
jgi:hypothetical protein